MAELLSEPPDPSDTSRLLTPADVAERLNVNLRFVRRLCHERRLPYLKVGRLVRFVDADVTAWLATQRIEAKEKDSVVVPLRRRPPGCRRQ